MLPHALLAGLACLALVGVDLWRAPGHPFTVMRTAVAGAWAAVWLAYGVNVAAFPAPQPAALALLAAGCAVALLSVPGPSTSRSTEDPSGLDRGAGRVAFVVLVGLAAAVVAADVWYNVPRLVRGNLVDALVQHRTDRANQTGAYGLPGAEMAHALAALTGALGYAQWAGRRDPLGALAATLGLASMLSSTGRWDVVGYALWCFTVDTAVRRRQAARQVVLGTARLFALLGVFFLVHGQLTSKADHLGKLAAMSAKERLATVNVPINLGYIEAASPSVGLAPEAARSCPPETTPRSSHVDDTTSATPPRPAAPAAAAAAPGAAPEAQARAARAASSGEPCPRWVEGARDANRRFQELPSVARVGVSYFAGPLAAFDRAICEGRPGPRAVISYWPRKIGRLVGLVRDSATYAVDPFVDIGVPFNNFTVIYSFWSELGAVTGLLAWLATALLLRAFSRWAVTSGGTLPVVVAGAAPVAIAVRTPWTNSFFDGTLAIWIGAALALSALSRATARTHSP
jgi:hypothetical protein